MTADPKPIETAPGFPLKLQVTGNNTPLSGLDILKEAGGEGFVAKTGLTSSIDDSILAQASKRGLGLEGDSPNQHPVDDSVISETTRFSPERLRLLGSLLTNLQRNNPALPEPLTLILEPEPSAASAWGSLYIGSLQPATDLELLRSKNITHIVQALDKGWPESFPPEEGLTYHKVSLSDIPSQSKELLRQLGKATDFIHFSRAEGKNVLVHCVQGISRSASIVIAYLIREWQIPFEEARKALEEKRPAVKPNSGFSEVLKEWEGTGIKGFGVGASCDQPISPVRKEGLRW